MSAKFSNNSPGFHVVLHKLNAHAELHFGGGCKYLEFVLTRGSRLRFLQSIALMHGHERDFSRR